MRKENYTFNGIGNVSFRSSNDNISINNLLSYINHEKLYINTTINTSVAHAYCENLWNVHKSKVLVYNK